MTKSLIEKLFEFDNTAALNSAASASASGGALKNSGLIVGTDEAGRGPGAGPVFAAAACFLKPPSKELLEKLSVLNDSKKLNEKQRDALFEVLTALDEGEFLYDVKAGSVEEIEKINILNTSLKCMNLSCSAVVRAIRAAGVKGGTNVPDELVLVDGNRKIKNFAGANFVHKQITVVKGDSKSAAIAAASILAKVSRDRFMYEIAKEFPEYCWTENKGYLTAKHVEAIKLHGACKWHRPKFLRKILENSDVSLTQSSPAKTGLAEAPQLSLF